MIIHACRRIVFLALALLLVVEARGQTKNLQRAHVIDVTQEIAAAKGPYSCMLEVEFSPSGHRLAVRNEGHQVEVWDTQNWQRTALWDPGFVVRDVCFVEGDRQLYGATEEGVLAYDTESEETQKLSNITALLVRGHIDRQLTAVGDDVWARMKLNESARIPSPTNGGIPVLIDREGKRIFTCQPGRATGGTPWMLTVLETENGTRSSVARLEAFPSAVKLLPTLGGGADVYVASDSSGMIATYSYAIYPTVGRRMGKGVGPFPGGVVDFDVSSDNHFLLVATKTGILTIWELQSGQRVLQLSTLGARIQSLQFAPRGTDFAVAYGQQTAIETDVWGAVRVGNVREIILEHFGDLADDGDVEKRSLSRLWEDLASNNVTQAYSAVARFSTDSDAFDYLNQTLLAAVQQPTEAQIQERFRQLGSSQFAIREAATNELAAWGAVLGDRIDLALAEANSVEARLRLRRIKAQSQNGTLVANNRTDYYRQIVRALFVLEQSGESSAQSTLNRLRLGHPDAVTRYYAESASRRLALDAPED